jgi:hypothetical protein
MDNKIIFFFGSILLNQRIIMKCCEMFVKDTLNCFPGACLWTCPLYFLTILIRLLGASAIFIRNVRHLPQATSVVILFPFSACIF